MKKAIKYVRKNLDMYEVNRVIDKMYMERVPLFVASPEMCDQIYDLMEEYGQENDLPEGWWLSECDEEDILDMVIHE